MFEARANEAYEIINSFDYIKVTRPKGAFYMAVLFDDDVLNDRQTLSLSDERIRAYVENKVRDVAVDKRFVYYLLGATGICVVPLTGFCCGRKGFRITLMETDDEKRRDTWYRIGKAVKEYVESV